MATKVKPCRIKATGTPQVGYVPKYVDEDTFQWGAGGGGGGSDIEYVTQAEYNALLPGAASDGKHYFIYSTSGGGGWQPGVNTIAYYPLTLDFSDASSNGYDLTNSGGTITSLSGVDCAYYDGSSVSKNTSAQFGTIRTISVWYYGAETTNNNTITWAGGDASSGNATALGLNGGNKPNISNYWTYGTSSNTTFSTNEWHNFVGTINGSTWKVYVDGNLVYTGGHSLSSSVGIAIGGRYDSGDYFKGYINNVIYENTERTAQEISDYYNQTKGDYGIS